MDFALFKSIFLRNRSLSNATCDFLVKNKTQTYGNLHLTEHQLSRNEIWCAAS